MQNFRHFHDGFLNGLWIDKDAGTVHVYLSTAEKKRSTAVLNGVLKLKAEGLREGNIIFDVTVRSPEEITSDDIAELYDLQSNRERDGLESQLAKVKNQQLQLFAVSPSYGGMCLVLARRVEFVAGERDV